MNISIALADGSSVQVEAEPALFGLAVHRRLLGYTVHGPWLSITAQPDWIVTDPVTGQAVGAGDTKKEAISAAVERLYRIAKEKGTTCRSLLEQARSKHQRINP